MDAPKRDEQVDEFANFLGYMAVAAMVAVAVALIAYWLTFKGHPVSSDPGRWGELGDYIGGIINPVFGFLSFLVLMFSLQVQRTALREARKQGVLEELQRLLASTAQDVEASLRVKVQVGFGLWNVTVRSKSLGGVFEPHRDVSVSEVLRYSFRSMVLGDLDEMALYNLADSAEAAPVYQALLRLDDCLLEFVSRGGDAVIGKLYGHAFGDAARLLSALQLLKMHLDLDAAYTPEALDRLGLQGHAEQSRSIRAMYEDRLEAYNRVASEVNTDVSSADT